MSVAEPSGSQQEVQTQKMTPSQPVPVPISYPTGAADFSALVGTPEFIQDLLYTPTGSAGGPSAPTAMFGSTPTYNYGFGSFGSVYPPPPPPPSHQHNGTAAIAADPLGNHHQRHHVIHGTPPSSSAAVAAAALYSTSPTGTLFSIPYHPPTGTKPQQHQVMTGLASQLQQMVLATNPNGATRQDLLYTPAGSAGGPSAPTAMFGSTPTYNYGFGSFGSVYPPPPPPPSHQHNGTAAIAADPLGNHHQRHHVIHGTPPSSSAAVAAAALYSTSPTGTLFSIPYHPPTGTKPQQHQVMTGLASQLQQMVLATNPNAATRQEILRRPQIGLHRSQLLDEYRNNRTANLQLTDLGKHVVEFAQDQHGSRFIQQKLERANPTEKQTVFDEVVQHAQQLMTDVFGNYVIQKFFEYGTDEQKAQLMDALRGHVLTLALQMYGCRVIQKALESVDKTSQMEIINELSPQVIRCIKDQNGNHVVQKIIERVEPHQLQFVIDTMVNGISYSVTSLSIHPYGCRVIQRVLEHCTEHQKRPVLEQLHDNVLTLVTDQYGNYVIQHVIEHGLLDDRERIVRSLHGDILKYAQHKFASNVIEKCLICGTVDQKNALIDEVCVDNGSGSPPLLEMMKDPFANYVVQKMLDVADSAHRKKMMFAIKGHIPALRRFNYGKHIITKLEKYFQKVSPMFQQPLSNGGSNNNNTSSSSSSLVAGVDTSAPPTSPPATYPNNVPCTMPTSAAHHRWMSLPPPTEPPIY
uniref:PUM-HD domain-containing protein n=1 Tax=Globodera rostochiensis TaxID=31243 RepID=A0A914GZB4_GLORO